MISWLFNLNSQIPHWLQYGASNPVSAQMNCMFTDTITNTLYLGGWFEYIGGKRCRGAAKWNGTDWDSMGVGFDNQWSSFNFGNAVSKILRYKNKIYYFGTFYQAGNYYTKGMATWNGTAWDSVGYFPDGQVLDADVYNDTLYICGDFTKVGSVNTNCAAKFDGTNWYPMNFPYPADGPFFHIKAFKNKVYATGNFYNNGFSLTAEFTQALGWKPSFGVQGDVTKSIFGMERIDSLLYFFGRFSHISTMNSPDIVGWSGTKLYGFGAGIDNASDYSTIYNIEKIDGKIYAVGIFNNAGGMYLPEGVNKSINIAEFTNNQWCVYADSIDNTILDIVKYNGDKIISGAFWKIDSDSVRKIAKWNGGSYTYSCTSFTMSSLTIGVTEHESISKNVKTYPNPVSNTLWITTEQAELENTEIIISNYLGQIVLKLPYRNEIDVSNLSQGYYALKIKTKDGNEYNSKFIKQ